MKFRMLLKDPDGISDAIMDAAKLSLAGNTFMDKSEAEEAREARQERIKSAVETWVEYGDYVEVEFDLEAKTARVLTQAERREP
jgi:hypothetical protein